MPWIAPVLIDCPTDCRHALSRGVLITELLGPRDGPHLKDPT
jgi:hypothetical protein